MGNMPLSTSEALELCVARMQGITSQRSESNDPHITARLNRTLAHLRAKKNEIEDAAEGSRWDSDLNIAT